MLLCSVIILQGQLRHPWPDKGKATKVTQTLRDKGLGHPIGKQLEQLMCYLKAKKFRQWLRKMTRYQLEIQIQTTLRDHFSPIR